MEQQLVALLKGQVEQSIQQYKVMLNANGMGKGQYLDLDREGLIVAALAEETRKKLVYSDIIAFMDNEKYYLTKDGFFLYCGFLDSEGAATIYNDITTTPEFISYNLMIANEDVDNLVLHLQDPEFVVKYHEQAAMGFKKGNENGHY